MKGFLPLLLAAGTRIELLTAGSSFQYTLHKGQPNVAPLIEFECETFVEMKINLMRIYVHIKMQNNDQFIISNQES